MAINESILTTTFEQGEDLSSAAVGSALKLVRNATAGVARVHFADGAGDVVIGTLQHAPVTSEVGAAVTVGLIVGSAKLKGIAGATINAGRILIPTTTDGEISSVANVAGLADEQVGFGIALEDAADGQVFSFTPIYVCGNA